MSTSFRAKSKLREIEYLQILDQYILRDDKQLIRNLIKQDNLPLKQAISHYRNDLNQLQVQLRYFIKQTQNQLKQNSVSPIKRESSPIKSFKVNLNQNEENPIFRAKEIQNVVRPQLKLWSHLEQKQKNSDLKVRINGVPIYPSISLTPRNDIGQSNRSVTPRNNPDQSQQSEIILSNRSVTPKQNTDHSQNSINGQKKRKIYINKQFIDQQRQKQSQSPINLKNKYQIQNLELNFKSNLEKTSTYEQLNQYSNTFISPQNQKINFSTENDHFFKKQKNLIQINKKPQINEIETASQLQLHINPSFNNKNEIFIPTILQSPKFAQDSQHDIKKNLELHLSPDHFFNPMNSKLDLNSSKKQYQKEFTYSSSSVKKNIFGQLDSLLKKSPNQDKYYDESIQKQLFRKNTDLDTEICGYSPQQKQLDVSLNLFDNLKLDICQNSFENTKKENLQLPQFEMNSQSTKFDFSQNWYNQETKKETNLYKNKQRLKFFKENLKFDQLRFRLISYLQFTFKFQEKLNEEDFSKNSQNLIQESSFQNNLYIELDVFRQMFQSADRVKYQFQIEQSLIKISEISLLIEDIINS